MGSDRRGLLVEGLTKALPDGRPLLRGISLRLQPGEFVGILGPSGAGKSLTMRCILGLTRPDGGRVVLREEDGTSHGVSLVQDLAGRTGRTTDQSMPKAAGASRMTRAPYSHGKAAVRRRA